MEPTTHDDIWKNYLSYRPGLSKDVKQFASRMNVEQVISKNRLDFSVQPKELITNLAYATAMTRIHYLRIKGALAEHDDIDGQAHYWKQHYNTPQGKGTVEEYVENYFIYVKNQCGVIG